MSEYERLMKEFHEAHHGTIQATILRRSQVPALLQNVSNTLNLVVAQSITKWLKEAEQRRKSDRFLCLDCDTSFHQRRTPDAFLIVTPFAAATGHAIVTGICRRCASRDDATLWNSALKAIRTIYPDFTLAEPGQA